MSFVEISTHTVQKLQNGRQKVHVQVSNVTEIQTAMCTSGILWCCDFGLFVRETCKMVEIFWRMRSDWGVGNDRIIKTNVSKFTFCLALNANSHPKTLITTIYNFDVLFSYFFMYIGCCMLLINCRAAIDETFCNRLISKKLIEINLLISINFCS